MFFTKKVQLPQIFSTRAGIYPELIKTSLSENFIQLIQKSMAEQFIDFYSLLEFYDKEILSDKKTSKKIPSEYLERNENYKKARIHFATGDQCIGQGQLEEAAKQFQKGLAIYPYFFTARLNLGYVYRELGRLELSLNTYLEGILHNGEELLFYTNIARTYEALGDKEKAVEYLWKASQIDPNDPHTLYELEKHGEMVRIYRDQNDPNSLAFMTKGEWEETIEHTIANADSLEKAVDMFFTIVREDRIDLLKKCWDKHSKKLTVVGNETAYWYLIKGFVERRFESDEKALATWKAGVSLFKDDVALLMNLAKVQEAEESLQTFETLFKLGDFSEQTISLHFHRYSEKFGKEKAIAEYEKLYELYKSFTFINMNAFTLFEDNKEEFLNYTLKHFHSDTTLDSMYWVGRIAGLMGELEKRKELILFTQKHIDENCPDLGIHWNWAYANFLEGHQDKALNHLNSLFKEEWMNLGDKETLKQQIDFLKHTEE